MTLSGNQKWPERQLVHFRGRPLMIRGGGGGRIENHQNGFIFSSLLASTIYFFLEKGLRIFFHLDFLQALPQIINGRPLSIMALKLVWPTTGLFRSKSQTKKTSLAFGVGNRGQKWPPRKKRALRLSTWADLYWVIFEIIPTPYTILIHYCTGVLQYNSIFYVFIVYIWFYTSNLLLIFLS